MAELSPTETNPLKHSQFSEYQILYSTNLVQKSKVWHDGKCKFFKFNKKLIIYNEENIVISTHFLSNLKVLEQFGKEIRINDSILIIVEDKLGEYERDISNLFNGKNHENSTNQLDIINKRITVTPEKENIIPSQSKVIKPRRIGLSKLSSPSYVAKLNTRTPLRQKEKTPTSMKLLQASSLVSSDRVGRSSTIRRPLRSVSKNTSATDTTPLRAKISNWMQEFQNTPTHSKKSKIDVYASDDDQDISEEMSEIEWGAEDEPITQTKTYDFR